MAERPQWQRKWTSKIYLLVEEDGFPSCSYRSFYRTPETPLGIIERLGSTRLHVMEVDIGGGRLIESKPMEGQP